MKRRSVKIPWEEGLHLRPAARLVKCAQAFRSSISLKLNGRIADARSVIAVILLSATLGTVLDLEASGEDEDLAITTIASIFETDESEESDLKINAGLLPGPADEDTDRDRA